MAYLLNSYIKIVSPTSGKQLTFTSVNEVEIESTYKRLTDTGRIVLPRNIKVLNGNINDILKRGSIVEIHLGYNGELNLEFKGYIARVEAKIPTVIHCEDESWNLKQKTITKSFKNVKLIEIVKSIFAGKVNVIDINIPTLRINKVNGTAVLEHLKKTYGLYAFFTYQKQSGNYIPVLNVGFAYDLKLSEKVVFDFQKNVIDNDLQFKLREDLRIRVKGISIFPNNSRIEVEIGDKDGDERTLHYYNLTKEALKQIVSKEIEKLKVDGYKGDFTSFGRPFVKHNFQAVIRDKVYAERTGTYMVDGVKTLFNTSGFRRTIQLGRKVA